MKLIPKFFGVMILIFASIICNSCSKSSTGNDSDQSKTVEFDGIWRGPFILQPEQDKRVTVGLIDPNGEAFLGLEDRSGVDFSLNLHGNLKSENDLIKGDLDVLNIEGKTGEKVQIYNGRIVTTMFEGKNVRGLVGKFTSNAQELNGNGDVSLAALDSVYFLGSSMQKVTGSWALHEEDGITTITIKSDGQISGGTNWGAHFSGQVELINKNKNLYRIKSFVITGADQPYDGQYHGVATVMDNELVVACVKTDGSYMWIDSFTRQ